MESGVFDGYLASGRNKSVDFLKLYAALLVILGHCMAACVTEAASTPLYNFIWLTEMPLFMFLSGFVNSKIEKVATIKDYFCRLLKNALVLLIPCFVCMLIDCVVYRLSLISRFVEFYYSPNLWFLWALFCIHTVFDLGMYLANKMKSWIRLLLPVAFVLTVSATIILLMFFLRDRFDFSILSFKLIAYYIPFFSLGYLFHLLLPRIVKYKIMNFVVAIVCFLVLVFEVFYFKSIASFDDSSIKYVLIRCIGSTSAIVVSLVLGNCAVKLKFLASLSRFGAFSLESYVLHVRYFALIHFQSETVPIQFLFAFLSFLLLLAMVIATMVILYFIPYAHLCLFGKSFSRYSFEKKLPKILR